MVRAIKNFNLENRAAREIGKVKPSAAPRHPSTSRLLREQMSGKWCRGAWGRLAAPRAGGGRGRAGGRGCRAGVAAVAAVAGAAGRGAVQPPGR